VIYVDIGVILHVQIVHFKVRWNTV